MTTMRWRWGLAAMAVAVLLAGSGAGAAAEDLGEHRAQVVAGRTAPPGAHPSAVALVADGLPPAQGQFCGGSLVRAEWVLTAAHCVTAPAPSPFSVLVGTQDLLQGGPLVPVAAVHVHPGWTPSDTNVSNDVALIRLAQPVSVATLDLVARGQESLWTPGSTATLVGWGGLTIDMDDQVFPVQLQEVEVPVVSDTSCTVRLGAPFDPASMLCAGSPGVAPDGGPDACNGDSGGPLMVPGPTGLPLQIGIVSWGRSCGLSLTAYTRVVSFRGWIDTTIAGLPTRTFRDIAGDAHQTAIEVIAGAGIAGGFSDGSYRPSGVVTRGQMATFLMRALELPPGPPAPFGDVAGTTHAGAIGAVAAAGIAGGFTDGTFRPGSPVTRGQMATFLSRALGLPSGGAPTFSDVAGSAHGSAIASVAAAGIATGFSDGTFRPNRAVTRGQMATFLFRALFEAR